MLPIPSPQTDLFARIERWAAKVDEHRQHTEAPVFTSHSRHSMNLRSSSKRQPLIDTSHNSRLPKRKASAAMPDGEPSPKRSNRPPSPRKNWAADGQAIGNVPSALQHVLSSVPSLPPSAASTSVPSKGGSRTPSPTRKGTKTLNQLRSLDSLTMNDLEECEPKVKMRPYGWVAASIYNKVPPSVALLHKRLEQIPAKLFPSELKDSFKQDAQNRLKPKPSPKASEYMSLGSNVFPAGRIQRLKELLDHLINKSEQAYRRNAHEREWGAIVVGLLGEFELWSSRQVRVLNVEDSTIKAEEFRIRTRHGIPLDWDQTTNTPASTTSNTTGRTISRMVDWCVGLDLDEKDHDTIQDGNGGLLEIAQSLNQSTSWIKSWPILLDIELKKTHSDRDPKVQ
ncbi:MAG: hypothetical protein Q9225_006709 [Loekoesia sp. 1 TL-2023]